MIRPPALRPGDPVAVCTPSSPADANELARGLAVLADRYRVIPCGGIAPDRVSDAARREGLRRALVEEKVKAVFVGRGGYGLLRVACGLDVGEPRVVVGFSDVTVLHARLRQVGRASVHGPVVMTLPRTPEADRAALFRLIEDPAPPPPLEGLTALRGGRATGRLVGGNLACLVHLLATPLWQSLEGCVVLLEDVNELPHRVDRMLTQLRLAGAFDKVAAVVLGSFTDCGPSDGILAERLAGLGVPVLAGLPAGHGARNVALPLGARATVDADAGSVRFEEGAVAPRYL